MANGQDRTIIHMYVLATSHSGIPYSRLFSLGANFVEFPEWAHNSRKFIATGLLYDFQLWVAIVEFGVG